MRARASGCGIEPPLPGGASNQEERAECLRPNSSCRWRYSGDGSRTAAGHRRHARLPNTAVYSYTGGMKKSVKASTLLSFMLGAAAAAASAQTNVAVHPVQLPVKEKLHLYLLIGQSNMAGRGQIGAEDKTPHPRVLLFTLQDNWEPAVEPVTHDKPGMLGVGPGLAFGKAMATSDPGVTIGLVPCAAGGTPLKRWERRGDLYSNAVQRARLAMREGTLKGILWHQGESDSGTATNANSYGDRLSRMIQDIRADLGVPDLPFVVGQIGEFLYDWGPGHAPYTRVVNAALAALPEKVPQKTCARRD